MKDLSKRKVGKKVGPAMGKVRPQKVLARLPKGAPNLSSQKRKMK